MSQNEKKHTTGTRSSESGGGSPRAVPLAEGLMALLGEYGVSVERIDSITTRLLAVPVSEEFSKPRSNLLLRGSLHAREGITAFVDSDLTYSGSDQLLAAALTGPTSRAWRELRVPPMEGDFSEALCTVLRLLGSPIAARVRAVAGAATAGQAVQARRPADPGRFLAAVAEFVTPTQAAAAYETSFRKELADQIATICLRPTAPRSALLWGRAGSGRDHLLLAAAYPLMRTGRVRQVLRVAAARIAAGAIFPGEVDGALMRFLGDAAAQEGTLLLLQDLDVCLTGSAVCYSLMSHALDRGLRMFATIRYEGSMQRLAQDDGLIRRLHAIRVQEPSREEMAMALDQLARQSLVPVAPSAIQTALKLAHEQPTGSPTAALGLLGAAMTDAAWHGSTQVGPDDVFTVPENNWPEIPERSE